MGAVSRGVTKAGKAFVAINEAQRIDVCVPVFNMSVEPWVPLDWTHFRMKMMIGQGLRSSAFDESKFKEQTRTLEAVVCADDGFGDKITAWLAETAKRGHPQPWPSITVLVPDVCLPQVRDFNQPLYTPDVDNYALNPVGEYMWTARQVAVAKARMLPVAAAPAHMPPVSAAPVHMAHVAFQRPIQSLPQLPSFVPPPSLHPPSPLRFMLTPAPRTPPRPPPSPPPPWMQLSPGARGMFGAPDNVRDAMSAAIRLSDTPSFIPPGTQSDTPLFIPLGTQPLKRHKSAAVADAACVDAASDTAATPTASSAAVTPAASSAAAAHATAPASVFGVMPRVLRVTDTGCPPLEFDIPVTVASAAELQVRIGDTKVESKGIDAGAGSWQRSGATITVTNPVDLHRAGLVRSSEHMLRLRVDVFIVDVLASTKRLIVRHFVGVDGRRPPSVEPFESYIVLPPSWHEGMYTPLPLSAPVLNVAAYARLADVYGDVAVSVPGVGGPAAAAAAPAPSDAAHMPLADTHPDLFGAGF